MWVLNEEKIELAKNKYGFDEEKSFYNGEFIGYRKRNANGRTIISFDKDNQKTNFGLITTPKMHQDLIYDLIKDDVIILKRENEEEKINKRIQKKEEKIQKLQDEIEQLKKSKGE